MRYLRNRELYVQLLTSAGIWLGAGLLACLILPRAGASQEVSFAVFWAAGILELLLWFGFTVRRYRKLESLSADADRLLHGERELELSRYQEGELAILANELEKLISRLFEQSEQLKKEKGYLSDSLADISHQLRTPLTSLNLLFARLPGAAEEGERRRLVYEGRQLLERISWLVEALLKISRIDAGTAVFEVCRVEADELVRQAMEPFGIPMELRGQELVQKVEEGAGFQGDLAWSTEALGNIIKNCLEHAGEGGCLWISARENEIYTEITVEDDGPGIDPEDLPHLFERFYKGKGAFGNGVGIGLSLARMIVSRQNGTVKAENRLEGGARFILRFYKGIV